MDDQIRHSIFLIGGGDDQPASFIEVEERDRCILICEYRDKSVQADADDFFEALCLIRRQLQTENLIPFCYGASLNVYPSAMARQMGTALKAYRLKMGCPALTDDLVDIFASGPDVIPAYVDAQEQFFGEWLESLRK